MNFYHGRHVRAQIQREVAGDILAPGNLMSNSFFLAFTVAAVVSAGAVDFVNQTKVTGGVGVEDYLAALPGRLGGKAYVPDTSAEAVAAAQPVDASPADPAIDQEALRQQMASAASQIAAASAAAQAGQPANAEAAAGVAGFMSALLKGMSRAGGQTGTAEAERINPAKAGVAVKPRVGTFGGCSGTGLGKRCKVGG
ncbi:MAG TPA: hypothetical protein PLI43_01670 [Albidovulum sp.]|uniref:hypothetical protein n=1 Tax=Albidovulum sp. TaxID=1872424 RepID=UPI002C65401B|nr:hypothetical protein [Albidovulum sp.]